MAVKGFVKFWAFLLEKENGINLTREFNPIERHMASNLTPRISRSDTFRFESDPAVTKAVKAFGNN
jgi:hypothetical protein